MVATNPTLSLLSTPWEYFVTIDQSALWQKHIAWAKPKGSDLKAYISSQYSSRMVLLSLLLATEMSVFFGSSPKLVQLRQTLNIWEFNINRCLPFWIGFFLLLNICVTISGILATFATWNVVSAVSDTNAHCLLRSSLGQYVTTLSPRLVVTSLYLFLLWFLLFVVEVLLGGEHERTSLHELLTKHGHLVLLWALFLVAILALFFSIVVPLSAFGRLVLHTGAMAEQPVLSEGLQVELLPRGLHVGLVIKAHHSQKRGMAVTKQYHPQQQQQQKRRRREAPMMNNEDSHRQEDEEDSCCSHRVYNSNENVDMQISSTSRVAIHDAFDDLDATSNKFFHNKGPLHGNKDIATSSVILSRFVRVSDGNSICGDGDNNDNCAERILHKESLSRNARHRRLPTTDTVTSVKLPPASILNLSMTIKEFNDVIDSAIDTSSCGGNGDSEMNENPCFESKEAAEKHRNGNREDTYNRSGERINHFHGKDQQHEEISMPASREWNPLLRSSNHASGRQLSPSVAFTKPAAVDRHTKRQNSHQELVTRHHRRVSSSRFLLQEWAQENRVRDLYGAAPPADLPHEIACMLFDNNSECDNQQGESRSQQKQQQQQQHFSRNNTVTHSEGALASDLNASKHHPHQWWTSPFASPFGTFHKNVSTNSHIEEKKQSSNENDGLQKPLLPDLTAFRDEELGTDLSSELLGERVLLPEGDRKQRGLTSRNPREKEGRKT